MESWIQHNEQKQYPRNKNATPTGGGGGLFADKTTNPNMLFHPLVVYFATFLAFSIVSVDKFFGIF